MMWCNRPGLKFQMQKFHIQKTIYLSAIFGMAGERTEEQHWQTELHLFYKKNLTIDIDFILQLWRNT